jgi:hypothetical protein
MAEPLASVAPETPDWTTVQLKMVPETRLVKAIEGAVPEQIVWAAGVAETVGIGLLVRVKVCGVPVQVVPELVKTGVTTIVAVSGEFPGFAIVNEAMSPLPLAAKPIEGLSFVQLKMVPGTVPTKLTNEVEAELQRIWFPGLATVGIGLTVITTTKGVPLQPFDKGVMV